MSKLSERCEARKQEAQALADKFNTVKAEIEKLQKENSQTYQEFQAKNAQYAELTELLREEEGVKISTGKETSSEVVE
jgi:Skp family chaperone for outer membrane proteins